MINGIPEQLVDYEVFAEGDRFLGSATIDLPEIKYLDNEISGAGIAGKISVPTVGLTDNMETTIHWRHIFERPLWLLDQDAVMLSFRGAEQTYDAATGENKFTALRVDVRALSSGAALGKLEPSEQTETESKFNIDFISIKVDDVELFVHDKFNFVHVVNGRDHLAAVRTALGL